LRDRDENKILDIKTYGELIKGPHTTSVLAGKLGYHGKKGYYVMNRRLKRFEKIGLCKVLSLLHSYAGGRPIKIWIPIEVLQPNKKASKIISEFEINELKKLKTGVLKCLEDAKKNPEEYQMGWRDWMTLKIHAYPEKCASRSMKSMKETEQMITNLKDMNLPQSFVNKVKKQLEDSLFNRKSGDYAAANRLLEAITSEIDENNGKEISRDQVDKLFIALSKIA